MNVTAIRASSTATSRRRLLTATAFAAPLLLSSSGCITVAMWEHVEKHDPTSEKVMAAIATPVTLALDVGLVVGYLWLLGQSDSCGCSGDSIHFWVR